MKNKRLLSRVCNPLGLGGVAAAQVPGSHTRLCQRGVVRSFKTAGFVLVLTRVLVASVCLSPSLHAGIIFTADTGSGTVGLGGTVSVPITVTVTSDLSSKKWTDAGFVLTWNPSVLVLQPTTPLTSGSPLPLDLDLLTGNFSSPNAGELDFAWFGSTAVPNSSTIFTVNFQVVGNWGDSTSLSGTDLSQIFFSDLTSAQPTFQNGALTVVPEPVNWALGLFACLFIGSATVRRISRRQKSLRSL